IAPSPPPSRLVDLPDPPKGNPVPSSSKTPSTFAILAFAAVALSASALPVQAHEYAESSPVSQLSSASETTRAQVRDSVNRPHVVGDLIAGSAQTAMGMSYPAKLSKPT